VGFRVGTVDWAHLSLQEQVTWMQETDALCGMYGVGLIKMAFARPTSVLLEVPLFSFLVFVRVVLWLVVAPAEVSLSLRSRSLSAPPAPRPLSHTALSHPCPPILCYTPSSQSIRMAILW
jgi:hypothetical protein